MPICQESLLIVLCIATRHPFSHGRILMRLHVYHATPQVVAAYWCKVSSTNQDSVLIMCERITVKNVQSQPSLTQSAKAAMSNIVWINRVYPMCRVSVVSPLRVKG
jgi:hypothetical protein